MDRKKIGVIKDKLKSIIDLLETSASNDENEEIERTNPGELSHRVIHLNDNPMSMELERKKLEYAQLKSENERLKARLELLESGNDADVTARIDEVVNNAHQIQTLERKVAEYQKREEKILVSFRKTSREFREACYLLTGYRVDALKERVYRLSSMYAENEEDKLLFEIAPDGSVQLLKNQYSDRLSGYISTYLEKGDSFPAFLAAITLDLYGS